jgi:galactitol-specific phosphotransferase system IIC component
MAANPVGLVIVAIAVLAAGFVLAGNKLKPFHDAVNMAFVLLKARVTVVGVSVGGGYAFIVGAAFAVDGMTVGSEMSWAATRSWP